MRDTRRSSKPEYRARYPDARPISQREHRCRSGLHRPVCGGSTPPSRCVRVANFDNEVPALNRREHGASPWRPINFNAPVAQSPERDASNVEDEGGSPSGSATLTGMWFNPNSRGSRLRIWQPWGCKSLHAHQPSLAAQREQGCRVEAKRRRAFRPVSPSVGSAGHFTATGFSGKSRPRRLKIAEPSGCKSRVADRRVVHRE